MEVQDNVIAADKKRSSRADWLNGDPRNVWQLSYANVMSK